MIKFYDEAFKELTYWPIPNLVAGEVSETLLINIPTPTLGRLQGTKDVRTKIWAKWMQFPNNPYIEISAGPGINMAGIPGPYGLFAVYVEALEFVSSNAFERVPLSIIQSLNAPAGWLA